MHASVLLLSASLFYVSLIALLYFQKKRIDTIENKIYQAMLIIVIFGIILDFIGIYISFSIPDTNIIRLVVARLYHSFLITIIFLITAYLFLPIRDSAITHFKKKFYVILFFYIFCLIGNFILPLNFYRSENIIYAYGLNISFLYLITGVSILLWIIYIAINFKKNKTKKHHPIISFILLGIPILFLQMIRPDLLLVTGLISFIVVFMYHTIENPDLKMLHEMEIAKYDAEKANNAKSDFLSSMSHEIRTPLNAIVGFSEINLEAKSLDEARENSEDIVKASRTLLDIVNDILDISKIESGNINIVNTKYNPIELFEEAKSLIKNKIDPDKINFTLTISPDIPRYLYGDVFNIKKIILNLLTNAAKYTTEGKIDFNVNCIKKNNICRLIISVEDTGRGIKTENIDKLFTKFYRLDEDKNTTTEGTGLGLAITKHLVELMGGNIVLQSVYGSGSKFTVALNQKIYHPTEDDSNTAPIDDNEPLQNDTELDFKGKKILLIDDNKINLKVAAKILSNYNLQVTEVPNGQEALDKVNSGEKYDLLFIDDMMPNMSGTQVLQKLKERGYPKPMIVLTANVINSAKEKYLAAGFDDYLGKPIDKKELKRILNKFLS